jgi:hypothetical protein
MCPVMRSKGKTGNKKKKYMPRSERLVQNRKHKEEIYAPFLEASSKPVT